MRVLFASDLHGQPGHLRQLLDLAGDLKPHVLLLGGDVLPDADITDPVGTQARFARGPLREWLARLRRIAPGTQAASIFGNHDWNSTYEAVGELEQQDLVRILRPDNLTEMAGYEWLGYWCAPPCPYPVKDFERLDAPGQPYPFGDGVIWDTRQERVVPVDAAAYLRTAPTIQDDLAHMPYPRTDNWILASHAPPADTALDLLTGHKHVGSQAIKDFILQRQPLLSLHGHIHESPRLTGRFHERLGRTVAVNPGQRDDRLAAVLVDLDDEGAVLTPLDVERAEGPVRLAWPVVRRSA